MRRQARKAKHDQVQALAEAGLSSYTIARQVGIHRVTVSNWLNHAVLDDPAPCPPEPRTTTIGADTPPALASPEPPRPWQQWDEIRQVREGLQEQRYRFLRRPNHLTVEHQVQIDTLFASPVGPQLQVARCFVEAW
jgi:hypothetical protein